MNSAQSQLTEGDFRLSLVEGVSPAATATEEDHSSENPGNRDAEGQTFLSGIEVAA